VEFERFSLQLQFSRAVNLLDARRPGAASINIIIEILIRNNPVTLADSSPVLCPGCGCFVSYRIFIATFLSILGWSRRARFVMGYSN